MDQVLQMIYAKNLCNQRVLNLEEYDSQRNLQLKKKKSKV